MRAWALLVAAALLGAGCGGEERSAPATKAVAAEIEDFEYEPRTTTLAAGGKVTWTNRDSANHTVTFKDDGGPRDIPNLRQGQDASVSFPSTGTFAYVCAYHPNMKGSVVVR